MRVIHKFEIVSDRASVILPKDAQICDIAEQDGKIYVWALFNKTHMNDIDYKTFYIFGTGHDIPDNKNLEFRKTIHATDGYAWHVFEYICKG